MKRVAVAVAAVAALALAPGAVNAAKVPSGKYKTRITSGFLKGNWTFDFFKTGRYKITGPYGHLFGHVAYKGTTVTFSKESEGTICPGPGTYRYRLTGRKLTFTLIKESCKVRPKVHVRTWTKAG